MTTIQVSQELLADTLLVKPYIDRAFKDWQFTFLMGRSPVTDTSRITMWRRWRLFR